MTLYCSLFDFSEVKNPYAISLKFVIIGKVLFKYLWNSITFASIIVSEHFPLILGNF